MNNLRPIFAALENIKHGSIEIELPNQASKKFSSQIKEPQAHLKIKDLAMIDECLLGGDIALGETYINDMWESNDLANLLLFFTLNSQALEQFFHAHKFKMIWLYLQAMFRKNTHRGSKKNIQFHYDLGNDFYQLWLDSSMTYSSGIFDEESNLAQAQKNKYQRILSKLSNKKNILEIGCGWGGFASEAVLQGYNVTGLTLSKEQKKYANNLGLGDDFKIKLQDYRAEENKYDNIVSIEMFEAVGRQYWDTYFKTIKSCLNKGGKAAIQTITIDDEVAKSYKNRVDFIQKYIFPGGVLPSKSEFTKLAKDNDLEIVDSFAFGIDYQKTLLIWLENFDKVKSQILDLGFNLEFIRKWRFYLAYCAAGFGAKRVDVMQFELINN
jgi:cyclopropane-fatty-acyl-phospholipid synthase